MACERDLYYWLVFVQLVVSFLPQLVVSSARKEPQVPCFFIFGDSLADSGNNNNLETLAKVNYPPYGIDFPGGPTGRFCNGRTTVDIIAQRLGFDKFIPPFATAHGLEILRGVNYASGSAGIRDETGQLLGDNINLNKQLQNHQTTVKHMVELLGNGDLASEHLKKCLYSVGMGSNDYLNNYFLPQYYQTSKQYTQEQYADILVEQYSQQLKILYNYGARKVALNAVGLIGCTPYSIALNGHNNTECVSNMNNAAQLFNNRLKSLVDELNHDLIDAKFFYLNTLAGKSASTEGFIPAITGCCEVNNIGQCIPDRTPCQNRNSYVFWDSFHPTEAVNLITGEIAYNALVKELI